MAPHVHLSNFSRPQGLIDSAHCILSCSHFSDFPSHALDTTASAQRSDCWAPGRKPFAHRRSLSTRYLEQHKVSRRLFSFTTYTGLSRGACVCEQHDSRSTLLVRAGGWTKNPASHILSRGGSAPACPYPLSRRQCSSFPYPPSRRQCWPQSLRYTLQADVGMRAA